MMGQNKKRLAIMIAGGDDSENKNEKYSDVSGEGLEISMKKVISAIKDNDAESASKYLKTWLDICQGGDEDEDFSSSKSGNTSSFDEEY